ncbi:MAG: Ribosomal large subunit pseudouridine synthase [Labilithrix sp.]|nr:Ribosomal large subunit pseudouridine synthase [Labilithrix sp.]
MTRLRVSEAAVAFLGGALGATGFRQPEGVPDGSVVSCFRVPPELAGQRLDVFLQSQLKRTSRTRTQFIVAASAYDVNGKHLRSNHRVRAEEHVLLWRAPWDEVAVPTDIPILYEDEHLFAVDKPANLPVHPTARYHKNTLINLLKAERPGQFVSLGHRIDRETSGVLLVSKSASADRLLKKAIEGRHIDKTYLAMTWNEPDASRAAALGGIATPAPADGPGAFRYERSLELDPSSSFRVKMRLGLSEDAVTAATRFRVEGTRTSASGTTYARVRCELETGRQHQIRVHLASLGAPIVGDKLYGPDETCFARGADGELTAEDHVLLELPRHALHAARLSLPHPVTGAPLVIEAPFPADLAAFWDDLEVA